jgi:rhamnogalacturonyl hydrolase YesR
MKNKNVLKTLSLCLFFTLSLISLFSSCAVQPDPTPIEIAKLVADKVINESDFSFNLENQQLVQQIQLIDFEQNLAYNQGSVGYAYSYIYSPQDTTIIFGLSAASVTSLWVNGKLIGELNGATPAQPYEESYNRFVFQKTFRIPLNKGDNPVLIKTSAGNDEWVFFLRPTTAKNDPEDSISFRLTPLKMGETPTTWLAIGPFNADYNTALGPEKSFHSHYTYNEKIYHWFYPKQNTLMTLNIPADNSYTRDSYLDWHYANGATMWSILAISSHSRDNKYTDFVKKYCDFVTDHYYYFKWQYEQLHAFRGSYHRMFRRSMLDDTGAPALPMIELYLQNQDVKYKAIIEIMSNYVANEQVRLKDGTLCRPEPQRWTVWADDLFMSIPMLLRMAKITGEERYTADCITQIKQFYRLLFNTDNGLCYHGWFSRDNTTSVAFWGRANGWMIWALSEALLHIPTDHSEYNVILEIYKKHMAGLIAHQGKSGMWHQVLDHPESFEETSCTAMYILAMARGLKNGWLAQSTKPKLINAWHALIKNIGKDGTVYDICRGTGIGFDLDFYFKRQRFDHDPRGLGAIITAALEVEELMTIDNRL